MAIAMAMAIFGHAVPPESQIPNRPHQIPPGDFATSSACKACHPREYSTWFGSYHRTMSAPLGQTNVTTFWDPNVLNGWGVRPSDQELLLGVQQKLSERAVLDFQWTRHSFGNMPFIRSGI